MKTVKQIDNWFSSECEEALKEIPAAIVEMAKKKKEYRVILAENIAAKKCFNSIAVLKYLDSKL